MKNTNWFSRTLLGGVLALSLGLTACDSAESGPSAEDVSRVSGSLAEVSSIMLGVTTEIAPIPLVFPAFKNGADAGASIYECPRGGTVDYALNSFEEGEDGSYAFDASMAFDACESTTNTLTGNVDYAGSGTFSMNEETEQISVSLDATMSGDLSAGCSLRYDGYRQRIELIDYGFTGSSFTGALTLRYDGDVALDCGGTTVTCAFRDEVVEIDLSNLAGGGTAALNDDDIYLRSCSF